MRGILISILRWSTYIINITKTCIYIYIYICVCVCVCVCVCIHTYIHTYINTLTCSLHLVVVPCSE